MKGGVKETQYIWWFSAGHIIRSRKGKTVLSVMRFDIDGRIIQLEDGTRTDETGPVE